MSPGPPEFSVFDRVGYLFFLPYFVQKRFNILLCSPTISGVGSSRRREARDIAGSNKAFEGANLGRVSATGLVTLKVLCHQCPRRGRYRTRRSLPGTEPGWN